MNLKETFISFTNEGKNSYFLVLQKDGGFKDNDEIVNLIIHFPRVVICGDEPFEYKADIAKIIKKATKLNPEIIFEIHTNGMIQPIQISNFRNIEYFVTLQLKKSDISYEKRISSKMIDWFSGMNVRFIFDIENQDDVDEVCMIVRDNVIKKRQTYLRRCGHIEDEELKELVEWSKDLGYNMMIEWDKIFWPEVGRHG